MKKILFAAAVILLAGCAKEKASEREQGFLSLGVELQSDVMEITKGDVGDYVSVPDVGDFHLKITNWVSEVAWEGLVKDWAGNMKLMSGSYDAVIWYGNPEEEGASKPYFYEKKDFSILPLETTPVTLTPALENCIVKVVAGKYLKEYFKSYKFSITTGAKNSFSLYEGDAVFMDAYKFTLNCSLTSQNGQISSFSKTFDGLSSATCYSVVVELSNVEDLTFTVTFNDNVETITINEELNI